MFTNYNKKQQQQFQQTEKNSSLNDEIIINHSTLSIFSYVHTMNQRLCMSAH
jgi:hypothetical protein